MILSISLLSFMGSVNRQTNASMENSKSTIIKIIYVYTVYSLLLLSSYMKNYIFILNINTIQYYFPTTTSFHFSNLKDKNCPSIDHNLPIQIRW